jgi:oligopeptide/dipeptide ABC transporter ATP-binding protein
VVAGSPALETRNLTVVVRLRDGGRATVVDQVNLEIPAGGSLGLVGESGSGKTMTSLAIMRLLPRAVYVDSGEVLLAGENLLDLDPAQMRRRRGSQIAMILQDPMTALDPSFTIRSQLAEPLRQHRQLSGPELEAAMTQALELVHLAAPARVLAAYPHQLSGGMRQRVTSAIALSGNPSVLIADEPTTALDVTTQARYLQLLEELQKTFGFALLLVTHDLLIVKQVCTRLVVMYGGRVVESGYVDDVFRTPQHPYTRALLGAIPVIGDSVHLESIEGQAPDLREQPAGCNFAARCKFARDVCTEAPPELSSRGTGHVARCWGTAPGGWVES